MIQKLAKGEVCTGWGCFCLWQSQFSGQGLGDGLALGHGGSGFAAGL